MDKTVLINDMIDGKQLNTSATDCHSGHYADVDNGHDGNRHGRIHDISFTGYSGNVHAFCFVLCVKRPWWWYEAAQIAQFMRPTWGPPGGHRWAPCWPYEPRSQGVYCSCLTPIGTASTEIGSKTAVRKSTLSKIHRTNVNRLRRSRSLIWVLLFYIAAALLLDDKTMAENSTESKSS